MAIVSDKPQTTRREIRGIATGPDWQLVLVDLPGVQRPRDPMTERMQRRVEHALADADAVLFVLDGTQRSARGTASSRAPSGGGTARRHGGEQGRPPRPAATVAALTAAAELDVPGEIFPISARAGTGVDALVEHLVELLPEGPFLYAPADRSDQPERVQLAELVREQVLRRTRDELPHAVEVEVAEMAESEDGLVVVQAYVWAESESQKAILIGSGGSMVKAIGTAARPQIEAALGSRVHLDLRVRVRKGWRRDDALLDRLGIE